MASKSCSMKMPFKTILCKEKVVTGLAQEASEETKSAALK